MGDTSNSTNINASRQLSDCLVTVQLVPIQGIQSPKMMAISYTNIENYYRRHQNFDFKNKELHDTFDSIQ